MPTENYCLELGGPRLLEVSWNGLFKNFAVKYDGQTVASGISPKQLRRGYKCVLPDGSELIAYTGRNIMPELHLLRNNKLLPELVYIRRIRFAGGVAFLLSGVGLMIGMLPYLGIILVGNPRPLAPTSWDLFLAYGVVHGILCFYIYRRSVIALSLTALIGAAMGIAALISMITGGFFSGGLIALILVPIPMVQAINAIHSLRQGKNVQPSS